MSRIGITKQGNDYASVIQDYDRIPKAVLAAMLVSRCSVGGDMLQTDAGEQQVNEIIAWEWRRLNQNGIVPQAPPKAFKDRALAEDARDAEW